MLNSDSLALRRPSMMQANHIGVPMEGRTSRTRTGIDLALMY
jgi:hypothetical protein